MNLEKNIKVFGKTYKERSFYFMNNKLAEKAKKHVEMINNKYYDDVQYCIKHSKIYGPEFKNSANQNIVPSVKLIDNTTLNALFNLEDDKDDKTVILNFASYNNPGGGFLKGANAQEEYLCHYSILYSVISELNEYYEYNRNHKNFGFYTNRAIYTPSIIFISSNNIIRKVNVLTCAAPNWRAARRHCNQSSMLNWKKKNSEIITERTQFIQTILQEHNTQRVILGAWGCGVFCQNPEEIASAFKKFIKVPEMIIAIPDNTSKNYQTFKKIFNSNK